MSGTRHEDLRSSSFADNSLDIILSSDVLEHIPDPYQAHAEIYRVLKPGGVHIFTIPFHEHGEEDSVRATLDPTQPEGIRHIEPPIYHADPLSPKGVLVFTIFARGMVKKLEKQGFSTQVHRLWNPLFGLLGDNGLLFISQKPR